MIFVLTFNLEKKYKKMFFPLKQFLIATKFYKDQKHTVSFISLARDYTCTCIVKMHSLVSPSETLLWHCLLSRKQRYSATKIVMETLVWKLCKDRDRNQLDFLAPDRGSMFLTRALRNLLLTATGTREMHLQLLIQSSTTEH